MGKEDVAEAVAYYDEVVDEYHKRKAEKMSGELCEICATPLYTDPGGHELSLWLHSLRYEDADGAWSYMSPLPPWALPRRGVTARQNWEAWTPGLDAPWQTQQTRNSAIRGPVELGPARARPLPFLLFPPSTPLFSRLPSSHALFRSLPSTSSPHPPWVAGHLVPRVAGGPPIARHMHQPRHWLGGVAAANRAVFGGEAA